MEDTLPEDSVGQFPIDPSMMFGPQGPAVTSMRIRISDDVQVVLNIRSEGPDTTVTGGIEGDAITQEEMDAALAVLTRLL